MSSVSVTISTGMVNDHVTSCFRYAELKDAAVGARRPNV
jgi:hypothetical protein